MPECTAVGHRLVGQSLDARLDPKKLLGLTQSIVSIGNWPRRILSQFAKSLRNRRYAKSNSRPASASGAGSEGAFPTPRSIPCARLWCGISRSGNLPMAVGKFPWGQNTELLTYRYRGGFVGGAHLWRYRPRQLRLARLVNSIVQLRSVILI
jgi:hypothetical protein